MRQRLDDARQWIELAATLGVDGLEFYSGFLDLNSIDDAKRAKTVLDGHGLAMPMMCCSPDFTHPDAGFRQQQVDDEKRWIDLTAALGGSYCRVLGPAAAGGEPRRRPPLRRRRDRRLHPPRGRAGVTLVLENHYKDNYWTHPNSRRTPTSSALVDRIRSPHFGVNYDPSNTILAGEDPLELLRRVKGRVVTMHASDRYLVSGTIDDLRKEEDSVGYAKRLSHGEIGRG